MTTSITTMSPANKHETITWPILLCDSIEEGGEALTDKNFIHCHILRGCRRMLDGGVTSDICLEIICVPDSTSTLITLRLNEAPTVLQRILDWRIEDEDYERCDEVLRLIEASRLALSERALESPKPMN